MRRAGVSICLGLLVGTGLVLLLDPLAREKSKQSARKLVCLLLTWAESGLGEWQLRLEEAIEAGKEAARLKERELEGKILFKSGELEEESPKYII